MVPGEPGYSRPLNRVTRLGAPAKGTAPSLSFLLPFFPGKLDRFSSYIKPVEIWSPPAGRKGLGGRGDGDDSGARAQAFSRGAGGSPGRRSALAPPPPERSGGRRKERGTGPPRSTQRKARVPVVAALAAGRSERVPEEIASEACA